MLDTIPSSLKGILDVKQDPLLKNITAQSGGLERFRKQSMCSLSLLQKPQNSGKGAETFQVSRGPVSGTKRFTKSLSFV